MFPPEIDSRIYRGKRSGLCKNHFTINAKVCLLTTYYDYLVNHYDLHTSSQGNEADIGNKSIVQLKKDLLTRENQNYFKHGVSRTRDIVLIQDRGTPYAAQYVIIFYLNPSVMMHIFSNTTFCVRFYINSPNNQFSYKAI